MTHETRPAESARARQVLASLRPQTFGKGSPQGVSDPIVEPLWTGVRALAAVDGDGATLVDADGDAIEGMDAVVEALAAGIQADGLVLDGFLTRQPLHGAGGVYAWSDEAPSMSRLVGLRRNRAVDTVVLKEEALASTSFGPDDDVSFIATDLLWLDDSSLLEVPLLERRRLLESALRETEVVRLGAFVRPPIETWVGSWRAQGFAGLTYKAANSRYTPGQPNPDWVVTGMPRR
jgi:bifunctional non-homologous end joining protein LigD